MKTLPILIVFVLSCLPTYASAQLSDSSSKANYEPVPVFEIADEKTSKNGYSFKFENIEGKTVAKYEIEYKESDWFQIGIDGSLESERGVTKFKANGKVKLVANIYENPELLARLESILKAEGDIYSIASKFTIKCFNEYNQIILLAEHTYSSDGKHVLVVDLQQCEVAVFDSDGKLDIKFGYKFDPNNNPSFSIGGGVIWNNVTCVFKGTWGQGMSPNYSIEVKGKL